MQETSIHKSAAKLHEPVADLKDRKIVYLINPISGNKNKKTLVNLVEKYSNEHGLYCEMFETSKKGDYVHLQEKIRQERITDVVVVGGDGSVNQALAALHGEDVVFGIIPYGSGNGLARAAGIPTKPKLAFDLVLQGRWKYADAFMVNEHYGCMLTGLGFDAQIAHEFAKSSQRGLITYTQQSILNFFKAHPYQFEVEIDGFSFFTEAYFISIANGNQFGNNFTIAPQASLHDGLLDIVIVQKMSKAKLPFAVLKQIRGNNELEQFVSSVSSKNILYFQKPSVKIKNIKHAPIHIDGDPCESCRDINIKVLKDNFKLIY